MSNVSAFSPLRRIRSRLHRRTTAMGRATTVIAASALLAGCSGDLLTQRQARAVADATGLQLPAGAAPAAELDGSAPVLVSYAELDETGLLVSQPDAGDGRVMPVVGIGAEDLVDTFGAARSDGRTHVGIDIPAPRGTPVLSLVDGWVVALPEGGAGGLGVRIVDRSATFLLYYAHLDAYAPDLWPGRAVRRRELIGYVGDSGNAQGAPHLHFEVGRFRGAGGSGLDALNPYHFLTRAAVPQP